MIESSRSSPSRKRAARRAVLLERNGELSSVASTLRRLGIEVDWCTTGLPDDELLDAASLVVTTAQRLLESAPPHLSCWPTTIAVVGDSSKTLSAHLHRIGVSMILCQPVHPQALRLLLLHTIYRGPERRARRRTAIGHPVRVGSGLFKSQATLLELSPGGARIEMARTPKIGSMLRLQIGKELSGGRPIKLITQVMRHIEERSGRHASGLEIGLSIQNALEHQDAIRSILDRFADGPAVWKGRTEEAVSEPPSTPARGDSEPRASEPDRAEDIDRARDDTPSTIESDAAGDSRERRSESRVPYDRRIVALDDVAARVLVACDLSAGGMRVMSNPDIEIDDVLRVALHCGAELEPLVVMARALRDDGDKGLLLAFETLADAQRDHLEKIMASVGSIRSTQTVDHAEFGAGDALVLGEVLGAGDALALGEVPEPNEDTALEDDLEYDLDHENDIELGLD